MSTSELWHPISMLPTYTQLFDGWLEEVIEQYRILSEAKPKPQVMDDETLDRVCEVYSDQLADLHEINQQLTYWALPMTAKTLAETAEVARLQSQAGQLRAFEKPARPR